MSEKKEHLDIDLSFLDTNEQSTQKDDRKKDKKARAKFAGRQSGINWKNKIALVGFVLLVCWAWFYDSDSNTPKSTTSTKLKTSKNTASIHQDESSIAVGKFQCSQYYSEQSKKLAPSEFLKNQLEKEQYDLELEANELEHLYDTIGSSNVTDYSSQENIDYYNILVKSYNSKQVIYNNKADDFDRRLQQYNNQVNTYNDYLVQNCTLRKH